MAPIANFALAADLIFFVRRFQVNVAHVQDESGRTMKASDYGQPLQQKLHNFIVNYTDEDMQIKQKIKVSRSHSVQIEY